VSYRVIYHVESCGYYVSFVVACCLMSVIAAALSVYWLFNWQITASTFGIDIVVIGKLFFVTAGFISNALFAVLYGASAWWTLIYKVTSIFSTVFYFLNLYILVYLPSLAIPPWVCTVSTMQWAVMLCSWGA